MTTVEGLTTKGEGEQLPNRENGGQPAEGLRAITEHRQSLVSRLLGAARKSLRPGGGVQEIEALAADHDRITEKATRIDSVLDQVTEEATPVVEVENGIPDRVFTSGFKEQITTQAGRHLACEVNGTSVSIVDVDNPNFQFGATLSERDGEQAISSEIVNKIGPKGQEQRHPDINALKLLNKALEYFETESGRRIDVLSDTWTSDKPENLDKYRETLRDMSESEGSTLDKQKRAAFSTLTGWWAQRHGFTEIRDEDIKDYDMAGVVRVRFRRPIGTSGSEKVLDE